MNQTMNTIALSAGEQAAERLLLESFARFWAEHANEDLRETYDRFISGTPLLPGVALRAVAADGVLGWWVLPQGFDGSGEGPFESAILFLHGGGYGLGSAAAYRGFASQIAMRARAPVFVLDYPLAPEGPFPAAHDAALAAARWLARSGVKRLALVGDSAGGGLALSALASMVGASELPTLVAGVAFSPWTDLSLSGASMSDPAVHDALLARDYLADSAAKYLGGLAARHPVASPLFGVPAGLPPLYIQVGSDELLRDDSLRYAHRAREQGNDVLLEVWEGLHHVFQLNVEELESSRIALDRIGRFLMTQLQA